MLRLALSLLATLGATAQDQPPPTCTLNAEMVGGVVAAFDGALDEAELKALVARFEEHDERHDWGGFPPDRRDGDPAVEPVCPLPLLDSLSLTTRRTWDAELIWLVRLVTETLERNGRPDDALRAWEAFAQWATEPEEPQSHMLFDFEIEWVREDAGLVAFRQGHWQTALDKWEHWSPWGTCGMGSMAQLEEMEQRRGTCLLELGRLEDLRTHVLGVTEGLNGASACIFELLLEGWRRAGLEAEIPLLMQEIVDARPDQARDILEAIEHDRILNLPPREALPYLPEVMQGFHVFDAVRILDQVDDERLWIGIDSLRAALPDWHTGHVDFAGMLASRYPEPVEQFLREVRPQVTDKWAAGQLDRELERLEKKKAERRD